MLEDFYQKQKVATTILINQLSKQRLSHAYLFETNGNTSAFPLILSFVKAILCPMNYTNNQKCQNCVQCTQIDKNGFTELKIIEPDGLWIKKEQLEDLQKDFSKKALQTSKRVYIIKQADRLNQSAANSILKFLEEPEENIIAILITDNIYQMLETIISRCQIVPLLKEKVDLKNNYLDKIKYYFEIEEDSEILKEKTNSFIRFITSIENKGIDAILMYDRILSDYLKDKNDYLFLFDFMIFFYKDCLNYKFERNLDLFDENDVKEIASKNEILKLNEKMKIITTLKTRISYNVNNNLLLDKLIMTMEGGKVNE